MDYLTILGVLLLFGIIFLKIVYKQVRFNKKSEAFTKQDIINRYEADIKNLLLNEKKEDLSEKKLALLKHISSELHRNIFFDENEAKEIIKHLASL